MRIAALLCFLLLAGPALAQEPATDPQSDPVSAGSTAANGSGSSNTGAALANPSGLPIPRFVSLRTGEINLRTGPGVRYPVEWIYKREGLPVEITAEYDTWRRIRDMDGAEGWVHQSMLSGRRMIIVLGAPNKAAAPAAAAANATTNANAVPGGAVDMTQTIYKTANSQAAIAARVEPGTQGELLSCESAWCEVRFKGADVKGYMPKGTIYGAYETETLH